MSIPSWPQTKRSQPTSVQREFRGANRLDPLTINDNFASDMSNITSLNYPIMQTRPGYSLEGSALPARILGLFSWMNSELHAVSNGEWYRLLAGVWTSVGSGLSTTANMSFTNFQGGFPQINLVGANGVDVKRWDGTSLTTLSGAPAGIDYIETYAERLWGVTDGNTLNFSEYRVATNWTTITQADTDPGFIVVETTDGQIITGVRNGPKRLIVFKQDSMFNLFGDYTSAFTLKKLDDAVGAISNQCITTISGIVYFVHQKGIYQYGGGTSADKEFSKPVQEYIDRMTPSASSKVCSGTDGEILYIGLPIDGATDPNIILEYHPKFGIWCVWNGYAPLNIALQGLKAYVGGVEGQVREIGGLTTDNGTAIPGYWTTKVFGGQSYSQKLRDKRAWIVADVPVGSTLQVYMSPNPDRTNDFTLVQNVPNTVGLSSAKVIIPTSACYFSDFVTYKFVFTGQVKIKELSWERESLPIF